VIEPKFDIAKSFSEGLAAVRIGDNRTGRWGYIDKKGEMAIEPRFGRPIDSFTRGLALVRVRHGAWAKEGYIDKTGKYVWKPTNWTVLSLTQNLSH